MSREVIYLNPQSGDDSLSADVSMAGWNVHIAQNSSDANSLLDSRRYHVGLALLQNTDDADWPAIEEIFMRSDTPRWIALANSDALEHDRTCHLINTRFFDYHTLPHDLDRLLNTLGHAYGMNSLFDSDTFTDPRVDDYEMVGTSDALLDLFQAIRKVASVDAPVLINGESGTGKELAALAIHERSEHSDGPFIVVNCGALPANLIQSELFGHEKGSFTGAHQRKIGRIEAAAGGTIFLDEIGDLPLDLQVNLLRFLQEETIERVGGTQSFKVDARVITATHVDMERAVEEGRLREDLYYRLNVLNIKVPPLRKRGDDIELLARFFFKKFAGEKNNRLKDFSQQALSAMQRYSWPGNVRELINRIRRAMVMCDNRLIFPADLGLEQRSGDRSIQTLNQARAGVEIKAIKDAMHLSHNNISEAARHLGISRVTLYRLAEKHKLTL